MAARTPADGVGIQVPAGRINASRSRWQTVLMAPQKPSIYRLHNAGKNAMIVEADGSKRTVHVEPGASLDIMGKHIRVKAGTGGGDSQTVEGWYVLVS